MTTASSASGRGSTLRANLPEPCARGHDLGKRSVHGRSIRQAMFRPDAEVGIHQCGGRRDHSALYARREVSPNASPRCAPATGGATSMWLDDGSSGPRLSGPGLPCRSRACAIEGERCLRLRSTRQESSVSPAVLDRQQVSDFKDGVGLVYNVDRRSSSLVDRDGRVIAQRTDGLRLLGEGLAAYGSGSRGKIGLMDVGGRIITPQDLRCHLPVCQCSGCCETGRTLGFHRPHRQPEDQGWIP